MLKNRDKGAGLLGVKANTEWGLVKRGFSARLQVFLIIPEEIIRRNGNDWLSLTVSVNEFYSGFKYRENYFVNLVLVGWILVIVSILLQADFNLGLKG
ncbi:MAG: hypothetical protein ACO1O1_06170 [Adhaeribacter sp.]